MKFFILALLIILSTIALTEAKGFRRIRILQNANTSVPINGNPSDCSDITSAFNQTINNFSNRSDVKQFEQQRNQTNQYYDALTQLQYIILDASDTLEELVYQSIILAKVPEGNLVYSAVRDLLSNLTDRYDNYSQQLDGIINASNVNQLNDLLLPAEDQISWLYWFNAALQNNLVNNSVCPNLSLCIAIYDSSHALNNANLTFNFNGLKQKDYYSVVNNLINNEIGPLLEIKNNFFDQLFSQYIYADLSNYNASKYSNNSWRRYEAAQAHNAASSVGAGNQSASLNASQGQAQSNASVAAEGNVTNTGAGNNTQNATAGNNTQNATAASGGRRFLQVNESVSNTQAQNNNTAKASNTNQAQNAANNAQNAYAGGRGNFKGIDILKSVNEDVIGEFSDFFFSLYDFVENGLPTAVKNLTALAETPQNLQFPTIVVDIPLDQEPVRVDSHYLNDIRKCLDTIKGYIYQAQITDNIAGI
jgi:hypothetical protein